MKFSIMGYSQLEAVKFKDTVTAKGKDKRVKLDATDLLILRYFTDFYPNMDKVIIDGKEYGWMKRSKVLEDLPILDISEGAVSERFKKLVHFKVLDYKLVKNSEGTRCYYTHGESYPQLIEEFSTIESGADGVKPTRGSGSNQHRVSGQTDYKDRPLDTSIKNNRGGGSGKTSSTPPPPKPCPECGRRTWYVPQMAIYHCDDCGTKFE